MGWANIRYGLKPHCELHLQILRLNTPAHDDALASHVWLQMVQQFRRYGTHSLFLVL